MSGLKFAKNTMKKINPNSQKRIKMSDREILNEALAKLWEDMEKHKKFVSIMDAALMEKHRGLELDEDGTVISLKK